MASIISAGTTSGTALNMAGDTSGVLQLATNGSTTAITIDTSQNVGIGTTSPLCKLAIGAGSLSDVNVPIQINSPSAAATYIGLNKGGAYGGLIGYDNASVFGNCLTIRNVTTTDPIIFVTNNTSERMRIDSAGSVLIGTTTSGGFSFRVNGTAQIVGLLYAPGVYGQTTASAANVHVASDGNLFRSTSSIKYKTDVQNAVHGLNKVMELRPVTYKGINDGDIVFGGLIAEEVHDAGLTEFVQYAEDGTPDALAYGNMVSLAFKAIQEQQTIINDLKARITALEGAA